MRRTDLFAARTLRTANSATTRPQRDYRADGIQSSVSSNRRRALWTGLARMDEFLQPSGFAQRDTGNLSGGRQHAPGPGSADGSIVRTIRSCDRALGPRFGQPVVPGGYAWWYVDAISDDGAQGLTIIAFIGSVFSPYYAWSRKHGSGDPLAHCALNVALYGRKANRWSCTERGRDASYRDVALSDFNIGPSSLCWDGNALTIRIDEITVPIPKRIRGSVKVFPEALCDRSFVLDAEGKHRWTPIAPCARVEVNLSHPQLRWSGKGYLDSNNGDAPLEQAFQSWTWSRAATAAGTAVLYDVKQRSGNEVSLAMAFSPSGEIKTINAPPVRALPSTLWRIPRATRADPEHQPAVVKTLEDTPFYARSIVSTRLAGETVVAIHESLSLDRFKSAWVQTLLPFRMPRFRR